MTRFNGTGFGLLVAAGLYLAGAPAIAASPLLTCC